MEKIGVTIGAKIGKNIEEKIGETIEENIGENIEEKTLVTIGEKIEEKNGVTIGKKIGEKIEEKIGNTIGENIEEKLDRRLFRHDAFLSNAVMRYSDVTKNAHINTVNVSLGQIFSKQWLRIHPYNIKRPTNRRSMILIYVSSRRLSK